MAIKKGDIVKLEYEGRFDDGEIFDSSKHGDHSHPLEFEVGSGEVISGFDKAVMGMKEGEEKEFRIEPEEAYGERDERLKQKIPREIFSSEEELKSGMMLMIKAPNGQQYPVKIVEVGKEEVTLDLNHPLAGKSLNFKIKILSVVSKK